MNIILVRHAKSYYDWSKYPTDDVRPLSEKGIERQKRAAFGMKALNLRFDVAWVSPYRRAQETFEIINDVYKTRIPIKVVEELIPSGDEDKVLVLLDQQFILTPEIKLLLVGHNPLISSLLSLLDSTFRSDMRTREVAVCEYSQTASRLVKFFERETLLNIIKK